MPWSKNNLPPAAKNLTSNQKEIFVSVANSVLKETGDEERAIRAGLSRAKNMTEKSKLLKSFEEFLDKHFGGSEQEYEGDYQGIAKAVDVEKKVFTAVVLRPNEVDAHGDIYDEDTVEKACWSYNEACRKANLQHLIQTDLATPVESYIAPADFTLGEGYVKKGDWVMSMKIKNDEIWKMCKEGVFTGFSVGCKGVTEIIDD